ncbi:MAG: aminopeptidase P family protein [Clostridiales bacterium]|jgi:Xaa-Pro aminopeptidase|nr:aminopeptidase P family protein [Clostridiales bacterium]
MVSALFNGKIDAYVILSPVNRFYFTNFESSFGAVVLTPFDRLFFTDPRYEGAAASALTGFKIMRTTGGDLYKDIAAELSRLKIKSVGYEDNFITVSAFKAFKAAFADYKQTAASAQIDALRLVKSTAEIANIAEAQRAAERALKKVLPLLKPGITERELSAELTFEALTEGAEKTAFDTIVAFGENSAVPHHAPTNRKFEKNDIVLIDFGAKYNGYCSDMTRTFCLNADALPPELTLVHNIVSQAQDYALKNIKAGMTSREADSLAREYIRANGYEHAFTHSLGHGVGLQIHEAPRIAENGTDLLLDGMVVTVEPGIYVEGLGGVRIEDTVVIRDGGIENLTNFDKNLEL